MLKDTQLLNQLNPDGSPILHLYEWREPSLTYGYFTDPARHLCLDALEKYGVSMARRPTGGGIIFHLTDLAFSLLVPAGHPSFSMNTLDNYSCINAWTAKAIAEFTGCLKPDLLVAEHPCTNQECHAFCMAKPTKYDLIIGGKKVGGAAQRRTKAGLLHQGSLSLSFPPLGLLQDIVHSEVLQAMLSNSSCLLPMDSTPQDLQKARKRLKELFVQNLNLI